MTIKIAENEMCDEDILSRKIHNHDKQWLLADLRLELDDTYADIDEAFVEETLLLEYLHNMELRLCKERREWDLRVAASAQRKLWKVKTIKCVKLQACTRQCCLVLCLPGRVMMVDAARGEGGGAEGCSTGLCVSTLALRPPLHVHKRKGKPC